MKIKKIGVIGGGIMGSGIAQVSAVSEYPVTIQDVSKEALDIYTPSVHDALETLKGIPRE